MDVTIWKLICFLIVPFCFCFDENKTISLTQDEDGHFSVHIGIHNKRNTIAWASLINGQNDSGWMYLEIETNEEYDDSIQAEAAGFAEGYLTKQMIHNYYQEFFSKSLCTNDEGKNLCNFFKDQIDLNDKFLKRRASLKASVDPYWHMVDLIDKQMDGIMKGVIARSEEENEILQDFDIVYGIKLINYIADIWDLKAKRDSNVGQTDKKPKKKNNRPSCSVLVKHLPDKGEIFVGHNTWHEYSAMGYRFQKKYSLNFHVYSKSKEVIPGKTMTMSSYPATLVSLDDFVTISSKLITTETSLNIYNQTLYKNIDPSSQLFEPIRVLVANRLSTNGKDWTHTVSRYNSGSYNNQWMVIDLQRVSNNGELLDGAFYVYEQLPGRTFHSDQTNALRKQGYWVSYNRAFYPEVHLLSGGEEMATRHGNYFSYKSTPRAKIMTREQVNVVDEESMIKFMRYNDFQNDPDAFVEGCNKPIPAGAIANRCDLTLEGTECSWEQLDYMVGHKGYGALDMKFVSKRLFENGQQFWAVAGPTHSDKMPPFSWINTNLTDTPLFTPIKTFDFQPIVHQWSKTLRKH